MQPAAINGKLPNQCFLTSKIFPAWNLEVEIAVRNLFPLIADLSKSIDCGLVIIPNHWQDSYMPRSAMAPSKYLEHVSIQTKTYFK